MKIDASSNFSETGHRKNVNRGVEMIGLEIYRDFPLRVQATTSSVDRFRIYLFSSAC